MRSGGAGPPTAALTPGPIPSPLAQRSCPRGVPRGSYPPSPPPPHRRRRRPLTAAAAARREPLPQQPAVAAACSSGGGRAGGGGGALPAASLLPGAGTRPSPRRSGCGRAPEDPGGGRCGPRRPGETGVWEAAVRAAPSSAEQRGPATSAGLEKQHRPRPPKKESQAVRIPRRVKKWLYPLPPRNLCGRGGGRAHAGGCCRSEMDKKVGELWGALDPLVSFWVFPLIYFFLRLNSENPCNLTVCEAFLATRFSNIVGEPHIFK